ncbi:MAG: hypothetical protein M5R36_14630 [Deltaproteobacteria bacterium]|nr:hypothetical protein [Deltaproteobacteria bacterium]
MARGTIFTNAYAAIPRTFPSWVSILTGATPPCTACGVCSRSSKTALFSRSRCLRGSRAPVTPPPSSPITRATSSPASTSAFRASKRPTSPFSRWRNSASRR